MSITKQQIESALGQVTDLHMGTDLMAAKSVKDIAIDGNKVTVTLVLGYPAAGYFDNLKQAVRDQLAGVEGIGDIDVKVSSQIKSHTVQQKFETVGWDQEHYRCGLGQGRCR